eukprot:5742248-Amphidinium_carterae.1
MPADRLVWPFESLYGVGVGACVGARLVAHNRYLDETDGKEKYSLESIGADSDLRNQTQLQQTVNPPALVIGWNACRASVDWMTAQHPSHVQHRLTLCLGMLSASVVHK